jgi:hypothetical protein
MAQKTEKDIKEASGAIRDVFEEFLNDYYKHRRKVFYMNFVRGIWFGFGSVLGGTIMITLLLWVLSWFQQIPFLTDVIQNIQHSIQSR